ncbi:UNVERIFIED_CONTAM: hypothetical protein Sangu_1469600 [Sesamum angustifolium]|uniref:Reverse transcriptase domain-containing protein n=1 Tax=Sesamum angustifolium TaxID=2727405 RepID=A0AAW2N951_9LAMI
MFDYLFVLVMEVLHMLLQQLIDQDLGFSFHWRSCELGLFQLCFADDLLLFCKADVSSVSVFKRDLDSFASLSNLHANPTKKGHLIISQFALDVRSDLLAILDLQEGRIPIRYIRLPLLSSCLSISNCKPLLMKIDSRIKGWEGV